MIAMGGFRKKKENFSIKELKLIFESQLLGDEKFKNELIEMDSK